MNPRKTRVLRSGRRQEVTGLVVNERLGVSRETLRRFRATLFQIEKDGPAGKRWGSSGNVLESIAGFANFVAMVDPAKGAELQQRVIAIVAKYGRPPTPRRGRKRWRPKVIAAAPAQAAPQEPAIATAPIDVVKSDVVSQPFSTPIDVIAAPPASMPPEKKKPWWKFW